MSRVCLYLSIYKKRKSFMDVFLPTYTMLIFSISSSFDWMDNEELFIVMLNWSTCLQSKCFLVSSISCWECFSLLEVFRTFNGANSFLVILEEKKYLVTSSSSTKAWKVMLILFQFWNSFEMGSSESEHLVSPFVNQWWLFMW
jgi:hypothetical protein